MKPDPARRPRVVLLQTQAENAGAQEIARILGHGLQTRGFDVHFGFFFRRTAGYDRAPGVFFGADHRPTGPISFARMASRIRRRIRDLQPDAVLTFQHYGNIFGAPLARAARARTVLANLNSTLKALPFWVGGVDWLLSATGIYTCAIANSASTEAEFRTLPPPFGSRLVRIDHGFEPKLSALSKSAAREQLSLPRDAVLLGNVGRLHPQKNQQALIALLPGNPDWHVALAGQGRSLEALQARARQHGCLDRVHFVGELAPDQVGAFLRSLDAFVFTSLHETFGLAAVEAANNGIPVVSHDLDVMREVLSVEGGPCARFADVTDLPALQAAVCDVLGDPVLAATLIERGRRLRDKYALDTMVDAYAALLAKNGVRVPAAMSAAEPARS